MLNPTKPMIKLQISKEAYDLVTDGVRSNVYYMIDQLIKTHPQELVFLDDNKKEVTQWSDATIVQVESKSLKYFKVSDFNIIATDPKGDIINGQYLTSMTMTTLDEEVPAGIEGRKIKDEEGNVTGIYLWKDFLIQFPDNKWPMGHEYDGRWYCNIWHNKEPLLFKEILQLVWTGVITIIDDDDWANSLPVVEL